MNIGIDIDDTISETFETLLPYAQEFTINVLKREPHIQISGNFTNHLYIEGMCGWNKEEAIEFWKQYYLKALQTVNIKKEATEVIQKLKQEGHTIFLITARWSRLDEKVEVITKEWLSHYGVPYNQLFFNAEDKLKIVLDNAIDIMIDDSFENGKQIAYGSNAKVYMMHSKANESLQDERITRVYSWPEIDYRMHKEE